MGLRRAEQLAVLAHRGATAGGIDDDVVEGTERGEGVDRRLGPREAGFLLAGMQFERAAAVRRCGCEHLVALGGERAHARPVDVGEEHALHAAEQQADPPPRLADGRRPHGNSGAAGLPQRCAGRDPGEGRGALGQSLGAELARGREHRRERAQPARVGEGLEQEPPQRALGPRAAVVALDLGAHPFDQPVVAHPGRAGAYAGHAAETAVEVGDHLRRERLGALQAPHR